MLPLFMVVCRALALALRGHREVVLEKLALRQQHVAMKRANNRPCLPDRDRLLWMALRRIWTNWRTALILVRPETVVGLASRVAAPAMDPALDTSPERPSARHARDPRARP